MEYVEGKTLRQWLERTPVSQRSAEDILQILQQAGRGLAAAHAAGIVHRDFKPGNVLLGEDGRVRVVDFGLAHTSSGGDAEASALWGDVITSDLDEPDASVTSLVAGTPAYMAPEQIDGDPGTERGDLFAFCAVAWEMFFGVRPFPETPLSARREAIANGRALSGQGSVNAGTEIEQVLRRGLHANPRRRFESVDAVLGAVERALGVAPVSRPRRRTRSLLAVSAFAAGSAGAWWLADSPPCALHPTKSSVGSGLSVIDRVA